MHRLYTSHVTDQPRCFTPDDTLGTSAYLTYARHLFRHQMLLPPVQQPSTPYVVQTERRYIEDRRRRLPRLVIHNHLVNHARHHSETEPNTRMGLSSTLHDNYPPASPHILISVQHVCRATCGITCERVVVCVVSCVRVIHQPQFPQQ